MNCKVYCERIPLLVLGEADAATEAALHEHFAVCPDCRAEYEQLRDVAALLTPANREELTEIEQLRIENRVYRELVGRSSAHGSGRVGRVLLRVAAVAAIFLLGFFGRPYLADLDNGAKPLAGLVARTVSEPSVDRAAMAGRRFTADGLKVIARGKAALTEQAADRR